MAVSNILSTAVSGLMLNSARVARAADNIANVHTVGYKAGRVDASSLVTGRASAGYGGGGVYGVTRENIGLQGLLQGTSSPTDLGISGDGFFVVSPSSSGEPQYYTRSGSFRPNADGYLVNAEGNYLLAHPVDGAGVADTTRLEPVNARRAEGTADASSTVRVGANLPSTAAVGDSFTVTTNIQDSLGNTLSLPLTFEKKATNVFTLTIGDVTAGDGTVQPAAREGSTAGPVYQVDVHFASDGTVSGFDADQDGTVDASSAPGFAIASPSTGAADISVALDFGETRGISTLTQFGDDFVVSALSSDGARYGSFSGVNVGTDGTVTAAFDNGETRAIYQLPLATFAAPNGLAARTGGLYSATDESGQPLFGRGGDIQGGSLEQSTVDLASEFVNLMLAETAYKASATVVRVSEDLSRALFDAKA